MRARAGTSLPPYPTTVVDRVAFHRVKYGTEVLVDVARIRDIPTFIVDRPHALAFYEIILVTHGQGSVWLDGHRHIVRHDRLVFTSPGQVRHWQVRGLDGICVLFPALFLEEFFEDRAFVHRLPYFDRDADHASLSLSAAVAAGLRRQLLAMRRELQRLRSDSTHLLRARLYEVLVMLARRFSSAHGVAPQRATHPLTTRFRDLVDANVTHRHDVASYARELAVSAGHLNTLSKRHLGQSAKAVIQGALVREARRRLVYGDDTAARLGYALGFVDPSYFTRFFRRATGQTPSEFRRTSRMR
ncbi:MAG TPA: AraC family transcriptional regulator [Gemmatimonadaceae bacterium]|nr:AraC family transcriptional regulator [Gemmatimonadaceae bacterium]